MTDTPDALPGLVARRDALLQERADLARRMHETTNAIAALNMEIWRIKEPERQADFARRRHELDAAHEKHARADRDA